MNKNILTALTSSIVALAVIGASPLKSYAVSFDFEFDDTLDNTITPPIVGTGTFSFDGDPGDGTFALTSLPNYNFSFDFNGNSFTNTEIATPLANILVQIATDGSDRFVRFGGYNGSASNGGPLSGSIDFIKNQIGLTFQPGFGQWYGTAINLIPISGGTYQGKIQAAPVPEPITLAGTAFAGAMGLWMKRKQKASKVA